MMILNSVRTSSRSAAYCVVTMVALFILFVLAPLPRAAAQEVFDHGHIDAFYVTTEGDGLKLQLKEDVTGAGVVRAGDSVILRVNQSAWTNTTEGVNGIGAATYYLPQTQKSDLVWPGWDTQPAGKDGYESVDFHFEEVSGPGSVYIFETSGFGEVHPVTTAGNLTLGSGDVINQPYPAHRHVNWAFTKPGTYTMTVNAQSNGKSSNTVTYTWKVGDGEEPPADSQNNPAEPNNPAPNNPAPNNPAPAKPNDPSKPAPTAGSGSAQSSQASATQRTSGQTGAGSSATPAPGQSNGRTELANTGNTMMTVGFAILGLGLLVLGLGITRLAASRMNQR